MSDVTTIEADVPERYADAVAARLQMAADEDVVSRIWREDGTLWPPERAPEVTTRPRGYDPRFLHFTGQLQPKTGRFLQTLRSRGLPAVLITLGDIDSIKESQ